VSWKQSLVEMQRKVAYIRHKVVGPFPKPCTSGSYVHRAALLCFCSFQTFHSIRPFVFFMENRRHFVVTHSIDLQVVGV
jgi:hypothetical protein